MRTMGLILITALVAAATAAAVPAEKSGYVSAAEALRSINVNTVQSCTTNCEFGGCFGAEHENQTNAGGNDGGEVHDWALSTEGCGDHQCDAQLQMDLRTLEQTLPMLTADELEGLAGVSAQIHLNRDRAAVQVLGCNDLVMLSMNLSEAQRVALLDS